MFRNVVVPVDGSALAEHALPWALAAAHPSGTVHLVHLHEVLTPVAVEGMVMGGPAEDEVRRDFEAAYLHGLVDRVRAVAGDIAVIAWNVDPDGPFVDALARAVAESEAELVVVASHGRGSFARFWLGSVSDDLLVHSPVPVLILKPDDPDAPVDLSAAARLEHLVVPLDGSPLAERIIDPALRLGAVFGVDFTLLAVLDELPAGGSLAGERDAEQYLRRVAREMGERNATALVHVAPHGPVRDAILDITGEDPSVGAAVATHGRHGIGRLLHGSVADVVVRAVPGPVLVFHSQGGRMGE